MAKYSLSPGVVEVNDSTLNETKENIRLDQIIPSEIIADKPKLREFLEAYYTFMNMDEFIYTTTENFNDVILDGVARFRVPDPTRDNDQFFTDFTGTDSTLTITSPTGVSPAKFIFDGSSSSVVDTTNNKLIVGLENQGALPEGTLIKYDVGDGTAIGGLADDTNYFIVSSENGAIQLSTSNLGSPINLTSVGTGVQHSIQGTTTTMTIPLNASNVFITNGNELPGTLAKTTVNQIGKTFTVRGLSSFNNYSAVLNTKTSKWVGPGPSHVMNTIEEAMDIDLNDDNFLTMMQKEIGISLPRNTVGNKRTLYKQIIDFYKLRGSSDSIEIFFRLLFNDSVEIEFPFEKTLIPSEGDWDQDPKHETQLTSAANNTNTVNIKASSELIRVGSKLISGTTITLADVDSSGNTTVPTVTAVDDTGKIITLSRNITLANNTAVTFIQRGQYLNQKGFLSYDQKIQDSFRFQKFSYLIKTGRNLVDWENAFDKLVHPAGFIYFAEILIFLRLTDSILTAAKNHISMPFLQPGVIGIEDIPLLVEAFASQFSPFATAKIHKSGSLSITFKDGVITAAAVATGGSGYTSAPTITMSDSSAASGNTPPTLTTAITNGKLTGITVVEGGSDFGTPVGVVSAPTPITFNAQTAVSISNDTITLTTAQLAALENNDRVTYSNGDGQNIAGLDETTTYFVVQKTSTTIKLSLTSGGSAIDLSSTGSGTSHSIIGQTATATFTKTDGTVKKLEIKEKGFGYSGSSLNVAFSGTGPGSTTTPVATIGLTSDGELDLDAINITNSGAGFNQLFATVPANPNATKIAKIKVFGPSQKNFRTAPSITIPAPDAVDAEGVLLTTNVQAVASFSLDSDNFISLADITPSNPGLGYTKDVPVNLASGAANELRANNQKEILILSLNHEMTNIHNGFNIDNFRTIINNGYKQRKGDFYDTPRLFNSNQQISFLGDVEIQNVNPTNINNSNTRSFVEIE